MDWKDRKSDLERKPLGLERVFQRILLREFVLLKGIRALLLDLLPSEHGLWSLHGRDWWLRGDVLELLSEDTKRDSKVRQYHLEKEKVGNTHIFKLK